MKVGRRLAIKILNASRFALGFGGDAPLEVDPSLITHPLDRAMLAHLARLVDEATAAFDNFDYARALERTEGFFWNFTDDHVELVKARAYEGDPADRDSARHALWLAISTLLRLFAPFLPFATEEVWSWWQAGSVHRAPWPRADEVLEAAIHDDKPGDPRVALVAAEALVEIRRHKTAAKRSVATTVTSCRLACPADRIEHLRLALDDVAAAARAGSIALIETEDGEGTAITATVELEEPSAP